MDKTQIDTALNRLFHELGKRIVFWNDPQREFVAREEPLIYTNKH